MRSRAAAQGLLAVFPCAVRVGAMSSAGVVAWEVAEKRWGAEVTDSNGHVRLSFRTVLWNACDQLTN